MVRLFFAMSKEEMESTDIIMGVSVMLYKYIMALYMHYLPIYIKTIAL